MLRQEFDCSDVRSTHIAEDVQMFLLLLMTSIVRVNSLAGHVGDPIPTLYEWYQQGDVIFGGMASLIHYHFNEVLFKKHPSQDFFSFEEYGFFIFSSLVVRKVSMHGLKEGRVDVFLHNGNSFSLRVFLQLWNSRQLLMNENSICQMYKSRSGNLVYVVSGC